ncbi:MAG TPA: hypothetical protein VN030_12450 [Cellvibrio sp.]|nr:hypothetical protein [Cellvibrio sp.]
MTQNLNSDSAANPMATLKQGLAYEVDDIVKLELTAEQMLQDEARLVFDYMANDARDWWGDVKGGVRGWELAAGDLLLSAADPTSVEWQLGQWWSEKPYLYHQIK